MEKEESDCTMLNCSPHRKLHQIETTHKELANKWLRFRGLYEQKYIKRLDERANDDRKQLEIEAAICIQQWWRTICGAKNAAQREDDKENLPANGGRIENELKDGHPEDDHEKVSEMEDKQEERMGNGAKEEEQDGEEVEEEAVNEAGEEKEAKHDGEEVEEEAVNEAGEEEEEKQDGEKVEEEAGEEETKTATDGEREEAAAVKLQAWWRGIHYRRSMLPEDRERLVQCVREIREAPCSEANPKAERQMPLNQRIERYLDGLLSSVLTERKAIALRLNRLAGRSHVCIECMLSKDAFRIIIESVADLNRSEAHLYVLRPICQLIVKFLLHKPFVEPFAARHLDELVQVSVKLIHNNYKDKEVVSSLSKALVLLSTYAGFQDKLIAVNYEWYQRKFQQQFGHLKPDDSRYAGYRELCKLDNKMQQGTGNLVQQKMKWK